MPQNQSAGGGFGELVESTRNAFDKWWGVWQGFDAGLWFQQVEQVYQTNLDTAQKIVSGAIDAQGEWLGSMRKVLHEIPNVQESMLRMADGTLDTMGQWLDAQGKLWEQWFAAARKAELSAVQPALHGDGQGGLIATWSTISQQAIEAQRNWLSSLVPQPGSNVLREPESHEDKESEPRVAPSSKRSNNLAGSRKN
jgi:hypothetical protein